MERRADGIYTTQFEQILPDICKLIEENNPGVMTVKINRFGGELFGSFNVKGEKRGDSFHLQIDDVLPNALSAFFMGIAMVKGEVCPGGIYLIDYKIETPEQKLAGLNRIVGLRNGHFGY